MRPERFLFIRPDHLGDLLFTVPALQELRQALPKADLTISLGPWSESLAPALPVAGERQFSPYPGFSRAEKPNIFSPYKSSLSLAGSWRGQYDICIISRPDHWWGAMTAALAGIPVRIGYTTPETAPFLTHAMPLPPLQHEVITDVQLIRFALRKIGLTSNTAPVTPDICPLTLALPYADQDAANNWLVEHSVTERFICIHPGAGARNKLWPVERYQALVKTLTSEEKLKIIVTGSNAERDLVTAISAVSPQCLPAAGAFSLRELAAIYGHASAVIGSDSGPLHLAVAAGTPTLHIFGPADERKFGPWGNSKQHITLTSQLPCRPCGDLWQCKNPQPLACMEEVSLETVQNAVASLLRG